MKLVRDRIPEIIKSKGKNCTWRTATQQEMNSLLKQKLIEEVQEYDQSENAEELADILEVMDAILKQKNLSWADIDNMRAKKHQDRGGFEKGIILTEWHQQ